MGTQADGRVIPQLFRVDHHASHCDMEYINLEKNNVVLVGRLQ